MTAGTNTLQRVEMPEADSKHLTQCVFMYVQLAAERRHIRHYWFTSWPDHHIPQCTAPLLRLVEEVEVYSKSIQLPSCQSITAPDLNSPVPIIVHCRLVFLVPPPYQIGNVGVNLSSSNHHDQLPQLTFPMTR